MSGPATPGAAVTYSSYLALDQVLGAMHPASTEHDEVLFITIHQVYELWFAQLLHELAGPLAAPANHRFGGVLAALGRDDLFGALASMNRVLKILKTVVAQVDVLETMTPLQFNSFRARLESSSGFQSAQFRELEAYLGSRDRRVLASHPVDSPGRLRVEAAMSSTSLWDTSIAFLQRRAPELAWPVVGGVATAPANTPAPTAPAPHPELQPLLLWFYRHDPQASMLLERLVDLDEGLAEWRYRHVRMVERTIGTLPGTGGSAGAAYLSGTLSWRAFPDLWAVRSLL